MIFYSPHDNSSALPSGNWATEGCNVFSVRQNSVTCQCNHLTHFAILLSPRSASPTTVIIIINFESYNEVSLLHIGNNS